VTEVQPPDSPSADALPSDVSPLDAPPSDGPPSDAPPDGDPTTLDLPEPSDALDDAPDRIIAELNAAQGKARHTRVPLRSDLLFAGLDAVFPLIKNDPVVVKIPGPVNVLGDIHGQFYDLLSFLQLGGPPDEVPYLFLGNYTGRGHNRIETIAYILALKVKYPGQIWLLRGPQESAELGELYGFADDCRRLAPELFQRFTELWSHLPIAGIVGGRIFCVHGGLSPHLTSIGQIKEFRRPLDIPQTGLLADLLLADANPAIHGFTASDRSRVNAFGADVIRSFLKKYNYKLLLRGHQCAPNGYDWPFGVDQPIVTVFSAPDYCDEFANDGAMVKLDEHLLVSKMDFQATSDQELRQHFKDVFQIVEAQPCLRPASGKPTASPRRSPGRRK
jgi:serine/threonine-protein phosphatase PP1 catalytic subunit